MDNLRNKKVDLRIKRTYKLLLDALASLIEEQPIEKITVTDICDKAMVHRTTFYKHFEDKYHLLRYGIMEFQKLFNEETLSKDQDICLIDHCLTIFNNLLCLLLNNKKLHILVSSTRLEDSIGSIFFDLVTKDILDKMDKKNAQQKGMPSSFIASFYAGAIISVAKWWFDEGMNIPIEDMLEYMNAQLRHSLN
ncbi:TetR/AcrR family transcriptional regulator C-terminal domain-containing protein [Vallitalea okinawensis]|uniref:TetR/AcrR family transcriptional regulator C-terminal domain-containing protein n=1 Tax=Vallitalea okinawensis TaxID=2078660 RepID=UPI001478C820|nr:TetR/AcrR family transcriptional regulator C-terminal domain-containing protein [Vallitalea okinawensis]